MDRIFPVSVTGLTSSMTSLTAGSSHTCGLTEAGAVKCWGKNFDGQIGDGGTTDRRSPVNVVGLTSGAISVGAGSNHTCAVTATGGVRCWGNNSDGQLGDGGTTDRRAPVDVVGLSESVISVAVGTNYSCAVPVTGSIQCWGINSAGQLGDGTTTDRRSPVQVSGISSGITLVVAGSNHTCMLTDAGGVKCWGDNADGQLGDGTILGRRAPVDVTGLTSGVTAITAGSSHTCAITTAGGVRCWGNNSDGQLGDSTITDRRLAVDVTGLSSGVTSVAAGSNHTCALTAAGGAQCWGQNSLRQIGDGTTTDRRVPAEVVGYSTN